MAKTNTTNTTTTTGITNTTNNNTTKATTIASTYQQKKAQAKQAGVNCTPRTFLIQPSLNIENLPARLQGARCLPTQYVPPIPMCSQPFCPPPCCPPMMNPCCPPQACQPMYPSCPMPQPYCPPPAFQCYPPPPCYPCPPPPCCMPYPPCPPCIQMPPPPAPPCNPCAPCDPCNPCAPCIPSCKPQQKCCIAGKIICVPKGQRPCIMQGQNQAKNSCSPIPGFPGESTCGKEQPASFNNCNFYVSELPKGFKKIGGGNNGGGNDNCNEDDDFGDGNICGGTSNMRNPAAGDEKKISPPFGYPGSTRKVWGYVDQEGVHLENNDNDNPNNFNQARNMDSNRMGMGPIQRGFNDDNGMPSRGKASNRNQQNYYDDHNEMSNRNFPSNRNQAEFSSSRQQMGGAKPSCRDKIRGPSNRNVNPSYSNRPAPSNQYSNHPDPSNHYSNHPDPSNHYSNRPPSSAHYSNRPPPSAHYSNRPPPAAQYSNRPPPAAQYSNRPPASANYSNRPVSSAADYDNQNQPRGNNISRVGNYGNASKMNKGNGNYGGNGINTARGNMSKVAALRRDEEQQANYCIPQDYQKPKVCQPIVWKRKNPCCMPTRAAKLKTLCQKCHNRFAQNMANCGLPMPGAPFDSSNNRKKTNKGMKMKPMARNNEYTVNTAVCTETDQKPCSDSPCSSGSDETVKKKSTVQIEMVARSQAMTNRVLVSQGVTPRESTTVPMTPCESSRPPMTECESSRPPMTECESSRPPTTIVSIIASHASLASQRAITNEPPPSSIIQMYAGPSFVTSSVTVAVPRGYRYIQAQVSQSAPHMCRDTKDQIRNGPMSSARANQKTQSETALQCNIGMPGIEAAIAAYLPPQRHQEHQNVRNTIRPPPPPPNKCLLNDKSKIQRIIIEKNPFDHTQHITVIKDQDMQQQRQNQCPPLNGRNQRNVYQGDPFNCDFNIYNVEQQLSATAIAALDQLLPGVQRNQIVQDMLNFQNARVMGNCNPSELQELDQIFKAIEIATQRNGGNQCRDNRNRNNAPRNSDCANNTTKHITVVIPENHCNNPCNDMNQQAGSSKSYQPQSTTRQNESIKIAPQRDYNIYDGQIQITNLSRSQNPKQEMTNQSIILTGPEDQSFSVRPQESFTITTTGSREPFFSVSSSHLPKNLKPYGDSRNETNANIAPLNEVNSRKSRAPKSAVMSSQTYNNSSYNQKNTSSVRLKKQANSFNQKQNSSFNQKQNSSSNQKQDSSFNQKQNSSFNQKQNSSLNQKQNSSLNQKQNSSFKQKQNNSFYQKQNSSFNQKQNSSYNQNPTSSNAPAKLVAAEKSSTQTRIRITDRRTEIEIIQTDEGEGMETDLEECEDEDEDYVPVPPPPATNTYRPQTNNNGDLNNRRKNDDDGNKRDGCGARNKYRCKPLRNCLSPRMVVCKGQKPIFSLFPPACPIRETNASIMRKHPPAHCSTHNQDATPFPDYCLVRDAHHDDHYHQRIKFVDHCKGGNDGKRIQNEIPAEYRKKDPVVKQGVKRRLHQ